MKRMKIKSQFHFVTWGVKRACAVEVASGESLERVEGAEEGRRMRTPLHGHRPLLVQQQHALALSAPKQHRNQVCGE
jgi:hypothetical protein